MEGLLLSFKMQIVSLDVCWSVCNIYEMHSLFIPELLLFGKATLGIDIHLAMPE